MAQKSASETTARGRDWTLTLAVDLPGQDSHSPLFSRIAQAVERAIRSGRLTPGTRLPGSRSLARALGVHRNTILHAYAELTAQGWVSAAPTRGTFVSTHLNTAGALEVQTPVRALRGRTPRTQSPYGLAPQTLAPPRALVRKSHTIQLFGGIGDLRLLPQAAFARAYRRALRHRLGLGYGDPRGDELLRQEFRQLLALSRGVPAEEDELLITRGSQMALYLAARALTAPGDHIAVEALGYRPAWEALKLAGAHLVPVAVDHDGLCVDQLANIADTVPLKAVYMTPHHQYPTMAALSAARRLSLLDLAKRRGLAILEDDYDHEFHYDGQPPLPLKSHDLEDSVVYIATLSKVLAPGLRIGCLVAHPSLISRAVAMRMYIDRQGDQVTERAVGEMMEDGELQRHVRRVRRVYHARRDYFVKALHDALSAELSFATPSGGMSLWARVHGVSPKALLASSRSRGVEFQEESAFQFSKHRAHHIRLGYAGHREDELAQAVTALQQSAFSLMEKPNRRDPIP